MLDRLILFSLAAHALQAGILYLDTRGWLSSPRWRSIRFCRVMDKIKE
jgi:hypothetical protein